MKPIQIIFLLIVAVAGVITANSAFVVTEVNQVMVLELGRVQRVIAEPGLYFRVPLIHQLEYYDRRTLQTDSAPEEIQSQDKKRVVVDSFTRWRITDAKKFYEKVRTEGAARDRLNIIVNSNLRRILAQETLQDIVSGERAALMDRILKASQVEAQPLGIEVVDVRIKRTDLPEANSRAVFARMQAEREKEAKEIRAQGAEEAQKIRADAERKRTIMLAEAERDAQTLRGEGDAESIRITGEAFGKDVGFFEFSRSLEAYKASLKNSDTLMVLDPEVDFFKYLNDVKKK